MELSEIHNCEKCRGKIVCIRVDMLGNTYCSYCGERVDYSKYNEEKIKEFEKFLKEKLNKGVCL